MIGMWAWTVMIGALTVVVTIARVIMGMLRAYYILRIRAGLPVVLWFPKFWRMDGRRQTGSSLSRVLKRMGELRGPHGMYGTIFGTQAVVHVADPEAAALVLSQHTKRPGYDHFSVFFGRGVFTADGDEWRAKRASVAHAMFRGSGSRGGRQNLTTLASEEADAILRDVEELQEIGDGREAEVEVVRLLQVHTLNLIHRFLCGGEHLHSSPSRRDLLAGYLDAVTDMRMVILARSRSVWMLMSGWAYRIFSPLHRREVRNMSPIREFAELVLDAAMAEGSGEQIGMSHNDDAGQRRNSHAREEIAHEVVAKASKQRHDLTEEEGMDLTTVTSGEVAGKRKDCEVENRRTSTRTPNGGQLQGGKINGSNGSGPAVTTAASRELGDRGLPPGPTGIAC